MERFAPSPFGLRGSRVLVVLSLAVEDVGAFSFPPLRALFAFALALCCAGPSKGEGLVVLS